MHHQSTPCTHYYHPRNPVVLSCPVYDCPAVFPSVQEYQTHLQLTHSIILHTEILDLLTKIDDDDAEANLGRSDPHHTNLNYVLDTKQTISIKAKYKFIFALQVIVDQIRFQEQLFSEEEARNRGPLKINLKDKDDNFALSNDEKTYHKNIKADLYDVIVNLRALQLDESSVFADVVQGAGILVYAVALLQNIPCLAYDVDIKANCHSEIIYSNIKKYFSDDRDIKYRLKLIQFHYRLPNFIKQQDCEFEQHISHVFVNSDLLLPQDMFQLAQNLNQSQSIEALIWNCNEHLTLQHYGLQGLYYSETKFTAYKNNPEHLSLYYCYMKRAHYLPDLGPKLDPELIQKSADKFKENDLVFIVLRKLKQIQRALIDEVSSNQDYCDSMFERGNSSLNSLEQCLQKRYNREPVSIFGDQFQNGPGDRIYKRQKVWGSESLIEDEKAFKFEEEQSTLSKHIKDLQEKALTVYLHCEKQLAQLKKRALLTTVNVAQPYDYSMLKMGNGTIDQMIQDCFPTHAFLNASNILQRQYLVAYEYYDRILHMQKKLMNQVGLYLEDMITNRFQLESKKRQQFKLEKTLKEQIDFELSNQGIIVLELLWSGQYASLFKFKFCDKEKALAEGFTKEVYSIYLPKVGTLDDEIVLLNDYQNDHSPESSFMMRPLKVIKCFDKNAVIFNYYSQTLYKKFVSKSLSSQEEATLLMGLLEVVSYSNSKQYYHYEISPDCIFLDDTYKPAVIGFRFQKELGEGVKCFQCPEQLLVYQGSGIALKDIQMKVDPYVVGLILYEILYLHPLHDQQQLLQIRRTGRVPLLPFECLTSTKVVNSITRSLLNPDYEIRQTAKEIVISNQFQDLLQLIQKLKTQANKNS